MKKAERAKRILPAEKQGKPEGGKKVPLGAGTLLSPLPVMLLTAQEGTQTRALTLAWTGIINSEPPMLSFSVRPSRASYACLQVGSKVAIHPASVGMLRAIDYCGVRSSAVEPDKLQRAGLSLLNLSDCFSGIKEAEDQSEQDQAQTTGQTPAQVSTQTTGQTQKPARAQSPFSWASYPPVLKEAPLTLLCSISQQQALGSHDVFFAQIEEVLVEEQLLNEKGALELEKAQLVSYSHGFYYELGACLGFYGYSVARLEVAARRMKDKNTRSKDRRETPKSARREHRPQRTKSRSPHRRKKEKS